MHFRYKEGSYRTCTECETTVTSAFVLVLRDQPLTLCTSCAKRLFHLTRRQLRRYANLST